MTLAIRDAVVHLSRNIHQDFIAQQMHLSSSLSNIYCIYLLSINGSLLAETFLKESNFEWLLYL